jgi:DNA integrity scanning protein DisA with diadenylate cyclase activity
MQLFALNSKQIDEWWGRIAGYINDAISRDNDYSLDYVKAALEAREMQCFVAYDDVVQAVAVTNILQRPNRKICEILLLGGKGIDNCFHFVNNIKEWAAEIGCDVVELNTRPGIEKWAKNYGFRKTQITMRLDI